MSDELFLGLNEEEAYEVKSSSKESTVYEIVEVPLEDRRGCKEPICPVTCPECRVCIHRFQCTCMDFSITAGMCKHIHFVCQLRTGNLAETNPTEHTVPTEDVEMSPVLLSAPESSQGNLGQRDIVADLEFLENKALEVVQKVHQLKAGDLSRVEEDGFGLACRLLGQTLRALDLAPGMSKRTLPRPVAGNTKKTETQRQLFKTKRSYRPRFQQITAVSQAGVDEPLDLSKVEMMQLNRLIDLLFKPKFSK